MIDITWLPYPSFTKSIDSLTEKQIEQAWTASYHTLRTLLGCRNPARSQNVRLWRGYEIALANYTNRVLDRVQQTHQEHLLFFALLEDAPRIQAYEGQFRVRPIKMSFDQMEMTTRELQDNQLLPKWFGWKKLHESHRLALKSEDECCLVWPWREDASEAK